MMEIPVNCPICNGPMLHNFSGLYDGSFSKICKTKIDHKLEIDVTDDTIVLIELEWWDRQSRSTIWWFCNLKETWVQKNSDPKSNLQLPFWEPDFSDYKRLIEKIKIYVLFA